MLVWSRRAFGLLWRMIGLLMLLLLLPSCNPLAWLMSTPTVTQKDLRLRLLSDDKPAIFDLRDEADFDKGHLPTSERIAFGDVGAASRLVPKRTDLVLVCHRGNLAALAAPSVRGAGHDRVLVLEGGVDQWIADGGAIAQTSDDSLGPLVAPTLFPSLFASILAYAAGAVIKPTYMLMSLGLVLWLKRTKLPELRLLRIGLVLFFAGEAACLFNFYFSEESAPFQWLECVHELGMAVGSAYGLWGVYGIIDTKFLGMNDLGRACALSRLCGACTRQQELLCQPQRQLRHVILLMLPLTAFPWSQELLVRDTSVYLFGTKVEYRWPILNQAIELRLFPALALIALLLAWLLLSKRRRFLGAGHRALFLGFGLLSFSALRGLLDGTFTRRPYWADIWEEITELLGIASVALLLWVFRRRLELQRP